MQAFLDNYSKYPMFSTSDGRRSQEQLDEFDDARQVLSFHGNDRQQAPLDPRPEPTLRPPSAWLNEPSRAHLSSKARTQLSSNGVLHRSCRRCRLSTRPASTRTTCDLLPPMQCQCLCFFTMSARVPDCSPRGVLIDWQLTLENRTGRMMRASDCRLIRVNLRRHLQIERARGIDEYASAPAAAASDTRVSAH